MHPDMPRDEGGRVNVLAGAVSPAAGALIIGARRVDVWRRFGLFAGPLLLLAVWFAPLPLPPAPHLLAGIMCFEVVWWMTEAVPLPVTALVGPALAVALGIATPQNAFPPFASPTIFLIIGSFIIGRAISV